MSNNLFTYCLQSEVHYQPSHSQAKTLSQYENGQKTLTQTQSRVQR